MRAPLLHKRTAGGPGHLLPCCMSALQGYVCLLLAPGAHQAGCAPALCACGGALFACPHCRAHVHMHCVRMGACCPAALLLRVHGYCINQVWPGAKQAAARLCMAKLARAILSHSSAPKSCAWGAGPLRGGKNRKQMRNYVGNGRTPCLNSRKGGLLRHHMTPPPNWRGAAAPSQPPH